MLGLSGIISAFAELCPTSGCVPTYYYLVCHATPLNFRESKTVFVFAAEEKRLNGALDFVLVFVHRLVKRTLHSKRARTDDYFLYRVICHCCGLLFFLSNHRYTLCIIVRFSCSSKCIHNAYSNIVALRTKA